MKDICGLLLYKRQNRIVVYIGPVEYKRTVRFKLYDGFCVYEVGIFGLLKDYKQINLKDILNEKK